MMQRRVVSTSTEGGDERRKDLTGYYSSVKIFVRYYLSNNKL